MSSESFQGVPLRGFQRCLLGLAGAVVLAGFGLSLWLTPDPRGFGTHQQIGFPPCLFEELIGAPCPSCGGTTSFAHFVRGQWGQALRVNAAAFALALACAAFLPWSLASCMQGRWLGTSRPLTAAIWIIIGLSGIAVLHWAVRIMTT